MHHGYPWTGGVTFSGIWLGPSVHGGYPCPLDIHTLWIVMDMWRYILWDRVMAEHAWWIIMHPGYPYTVDIHGQM
jgi:hypothetical protein